ncbi:MAG: mannose-1-phosphate guanylyltransferase [Kiritimatiellae bacterium]|jgi:mannose-1-phosphate guanylyltransferase|nr:mannose-1-phosphate guanylyltransferase [Kiritimatiellia bacterium]
MLDKCYAVIMAGGRGERFWPMSTSKKPKQLLSLLGEKTLLAMAVDRLDGLIPPERVFVITNAEIVEASQKAAPALLPENIIGEPFGRDTAAVCALASAIVRRKDPDGAFCILTADQLIENLEVFQNTLRQGLTRALKQDTIITIGINPGFPATGFGYIEAGKSTGNQAGVEFFDVERFVEKPNLETAVKYVASGNYFWNAGMFIWSVKTVRTALSNFVPNLLELADTMEQYATGTSEFDAKLEEEYGKLEKTSIDYAIMEKADNIQMIKGVFEWDDVGSWPAIENHLDKTEDNNVVIGECLSMDSSNNIVVSEDGLTALIGVKDLVVVKVDGVTMVCNKSKAQDIKKMVAMVKSNGNFDQLI